MAASAAEFVCNAAELFGLASGHQAAGNFAADHLKAGLALAVDAVFETEGAEFVVRDVSGQDFLGLGPKGLDLLTDRDFVLFFKAFSLNELLLDCGSHNRLISDRD
jgi:hypothetical protein